MMMGKVNSMFSIHRWGKNEKKPVAKLPPKKEPGISHWGKGHPKSRGPQPVKKEAGIFHWGKGHPKSVEPQPVKKEAAKKASKLDAPLKLSQAAKREWQVRKELEARCWSMRVNYCKTNISGEPYGNLVRFDVPGRHTSKGEKLEGGSFAAAMKNSLDAVATAQKSKVSVPPVGSDAELEFRLRQELEKRCWWTQTEFHRAPTQAASYTLTVKYEHPSKPLGSLTRRVTASSYLDALKQALAAVENT